MKYWITVFTMFLVSPAFAQDKVTLLLDWFINPDHGPIILAEELGYFDDQNLEVAIMPPADPSVPPKLELPHLNCSSAMLSKRRTENGGQTTEAGRDYHEVAAS